MNENKILQNDTNVINWFQWVKNVWTFGSENLNKFFCSCGSDLNKVQKDLWSSSQNCSAQTDSQEVSVHVIPQCLLLTEDWILTGLWLLDVDSVSLNSFCTRFTFIISYCSAEPTSFFSTSACRQTLWHYPAGDLPPHELSRSRHFLCSVVGCQSGLQCHSVLAWIPVQCNAYSSLRNRDVNQLQWILQVCNCYSTVLHLTEHFVPFDWSWLGAN